MGKDPAPTRTSTDFVDPPSRYLMIDSATEGVEWENVTTDKMFQMVCEAMKKTIDENSSDTAESKTPRELPASLQMALNTCCKSMVGSTNQDT